jgi:hypothetical protein
MAGIGHRQKFRGMYIVCPQCAATNKA